MCFTSAIKALAAACEIKDVTWPKWAIGLSKAAEFTMSNNFDWERDTKAIKVPWNTWSNINISMQQNAQFFTKTQGDKGVWYDSPGNAQHSSVSGLSDHICTGRMQGDHMPQVRPTTSPNIPAKNHKNELISTRQQLNIIMKCCNERELDRLGQVMYVRGSTEFHGNWQSTHQTHCLPRWMLRTDPANSTTKLCHPATPPTEEIFQCIFQSNILTCQWIICKMMRFLTIRTPCCSKTGVFLPTTFPRPSGILCMLRI